MHFLCELFRSRIIKFYVIWLKNVVFRLFAHSFRPRPPFNPIFSFSLKTHSRPEPLITEERSAWDLGSKGFLAIQTCEDGYDYTLYHKDFTEIDGGQIDNSEISMNAARDQILSDYGFGGRTMTRIDYDELCDRAEEAEISRRESVLGKLSDLSSRTDTPVKAAKAKEAER